MNQLWHKKSKATVGDSATLTKNINTHDHNYFLNKKEHLLKLSLMCPV